MEASGENIIGTGRDFWALLCETGFYFAAAFVEHVEGGLHEVGRLLLRAYANVGLVTGISLYVLGFLFPNAALHSSSS